MSENEGPHKIGLVIFSSGIVSSDTKVNQNHITETIDGSTIGVPSNTSGDYDSVVSDVKTNGSGNSFMGYFVWHKGLFGYSNLFGKFGGGLSIQGDYRNR